MFLVLHPYHMEMQLETYENQVNNLCIETLEKFEYIKTNGQFLVHFHMFRMNKYSEISTHF